MTPEDMRAVVQAVEARTQVGPMLRPATCVSFRPGDRVATVLLDGDPDTGPVEAVPLTTDFGDGDRVTVMFDRPQGVYVVGVIGRIHEAGTMLQFQQFEGTLDDVTSLGSFVTVSQEQSTLSAGRQYLLTVSIRAAFVPAPFDEVLVETSAGVSFYPGVVEDFEVIGAGVSYIGSSPVKGFDQQTFVISPAVDYSTNFLFRTGVYFGTANVQATMTLVDAGPAVPSLDGSDVESAGS